MYKKSTTQARKDNLYKPTPKKNAEEKTVQKFHRKKKNPSGGKTQKLSKKAFREQERKHPVEENESCTKSFDNPK
jgi:hypothetical protein